VRRAFRVAATFAGAAAGAAAFAPAAGAATAVPNTTAAPVFNNCPAGTSHYVHLYFSPSKHHGPQCLGYNGTHYFPNSKSPTGVLYSAFCPGNNNGYIFWWDPASGYQNYHFIAGGNGLRGYLDVSEVYISGHTGNATCPAQGPG
jgi:hypothetical protein